MVIVRSLLHACALGCRRTDKTRSGRRWRGLFGVLLVWDCELAYLATPSMVLSHLRAESFVAEISNSLRCLDECPGGSSVVENVCSVSFKLSDIVP